MTTVAAEVGGNFQRIERAIAAACKRAGRSPGDVRLVGAGKRQPIERLRAAYDAGLMIFGENRVQEAEANQPRLPESISWHLIGPLQSNKTRRAAQLFDAVHSVDRLKIGQRLGSAAADLGRRLEVFCEVNLGGEESKHGFAPEGLAAAIRPLADVDGIQVVGLMAIPPPEDDAERARGWFRRLRELRDDVCSRPEWSSCPGYLSMGMSGDFELAIEEGATHVRVGTALFGARPTT